MALIICTECDKEISEKAKACPHCGCPNNQVRCPECSSFVDNAITDCPKCGYPINGHKPETTYNTPSYKAPPATSDSNMKKGCLIVGGVVLLLFGVVANMLGAKVLGVSALFIAMVGYLLLKGSKEY